MKPVTKAWPLLLIGLFVGGVFLFAASIFLPAKDMNLLAQLALVLFSSLPIIALFGLIRSVVSLASGDCRRRSGLVAPVLTILIALAVWTAAVLVIVSIPLRIAEAQVAAARIHLAELDAGLARYMADCGAPPTAAQGLDALVTNPGITGWRGPYLAGGQIALDPWGMVYRYRLVDGKPVVDSVGPDLEFDTEDDVSSEQH